jgi:HPt (histidine-containing phosphotransfer) domain-containing protein
VDSGDNQGVQTGDTISVLDREQLRGITMDDEDLMREIVAVLIDDTSQQMKLLGEAIRDRDAANCKRLAHYSKGACANVGATRAASLLKQIERQATAGDFRECSLALENLGRELDLLRNEAI